MQTIRSGNMAHAASKSLGFVQESHLCHYFTASDLVLEQLHTCFDFWK